MWRNMVGLLENVLEENFTKRFHLGRLGTFEALIHGFHYIFVASLMKSLVRKIGTKARNPWLNEALCRR
jgi:hypothetical protein